MRTDPTPTDHATRRHTSFGRFWQRFKRQRPALVAAGGLILLVASALFAPWVAAYNPAAQDLRAAFQEPNLTHWLGTDALGRDTLSRIIYGARPSLWAGFCGLGLAAVLGIPLGMLAGYSQGIFDRLLMRVVDMLFALPSVIVAFAVLSIMGPGTGNVIVAIGLLIATFYVRLTRGVVLAEREQLYVESARVGGIATPMILWHHLLPNIAPPIIVQTAQFFGIVLLIESGLSFLGLGTGVNEPSWGRMLADAQSSIFRQPFLPLPPGLALTLTVLACNLLGGGLRDALEREHDVVVAAVPQPRPAPPAAAKRGTTPFALLHPVPPVAAPLLAVRGLEVRFPGRQQQELSILHDVAFDVAPGKTLGIVGESGSGKSMTALALLGLVPAPGRISAGEIWLNGRNLVGLSEAEVRRVRGRELAMVFQEPMIALNPVLSVGQQLAEPLQRLHGMGRRQARARGIELLDLVRMPKPTQWIDQYPHQLSGGMAQRVMIARALACNQRLLVADEPTTALDVTVQGQILTMLTDLQRQLGMTLIVITHDLAVIAEICDHVVVMYAGEVVELAPTPELFQAPRHPYSAALLHTLSHPDLPGLRLPVLLGMVPDASQWPTGCRFHPRCSFADGNCSTMHPTLQPLAAEQASRCMRLHEIESLKLQ